MERIPFMPDNIVGFLDAHGPSMSLSSGPDWILDGLFKSSAPTFRQPTMIKPTEALYRALPSKAESPIEKQSGRSDGKRFAMSEDAPIDLCTFGGALRYGYRLVAHCPACSRCEELDLARYPPDLVFVGRRFRCLVCESVGSISVSQVEIGGTDQAVLNEWRRR